MIAIDLRKHQLGHDDPKARQKINFTGNLENKSVIFFIIKEGKVTVLDSSQGTVKFRNFSFCFNIKWLDITL